MGDAVMAFFGAPIPHADHPRRAVAAAARMIEAALAWNGERVARGEEPVAIRIGINTGNAIVGDIGSDQRVDYTSALRLLSSAARGDGVRAAIDALLRLMRQAGAVAARAAVLGANDGIVSTASLVVGVAAANAAGGDGDGGGDSRGAFHRR